MAQTQNAVVCAGAENLYNSDDDSDSDSDSDIWYDMIWYIYDKCIPVKGILEWIAINGLLTGLQLDIHYNSPLASAIAAY